MNTPPTPSQGKNTMLAALLSCIPGAGHIYLGQRVKGISLLVGSMFGTVAFPLLPLFNLPLCITDASVLAKRTKQGQTLGPWEWCWSRTGKVPEGWRLVDVRTKSRSQVPIGSEERVVDNLHSSSKLVRHLKVTREWTFSYTTEHETTDKTVNTTNLQIQGGPNRSTSVEASIRDKYGSSQNERKTREETVEIEAPPFKRTRVTMEWKNIVEEGEVIIANAQGETKAVPYAAVVDVTFDIVQNDESPA